jgi:hypothetical protein
MAAISFVVTMIFSTATALLAPDLGGDAQFLAAALSV